MSGILKPLLVFTDLDGSLLDHTTYDHAPADEWLARLSQWRVPVIVNTSKTAAEVMVLYRTLGLDAPFVCENGASVCLPPGWCLDEVPDESGFATLISGMPRASIRDFLGALRMREGFRFQGFGDMSVEEIARRTGLSPEAAARAAERSGSEPLVWEDSEAALERFRLLLVGAGLALTRGGRFHHVMGEGCDKGRAVVRLSDRYQLMVGEKPTTIGLGDGPNDLPMLAAVDRAVLIRGEHAIDMDSAGAFETACPGATQTATQIYTTTQKGPAGWSEGLDHWLGKH